LKSLPLTCPCELKSSLKRISRGFVCENHQCEHSEDGNFFPLERNIPILVSEKRCDTVCREGKNQTYVRRPFSRYSFIKKIIKGESQTTKENCIKFLQELFLLNECPKVLVIGSGEKGVGTDQLWTNDKIEIHGVDIYGSNSVDIICDAHYLPLENEHYDGVWIQAVLEHVVEPQKVVAEIYRILKPSGLVYAETPFMQQVHEGAYDFTRFTVLGHRYLFKNFESIDIGGNKGPELVFAWATRYLIWSITRSKNLARLIGLFVNFLLRPIAPLVSAKSMFDASSGVYFLGKKKLDFKLTHKDTVRLYQGQQC
jgi:SAM-dependent methyltransferase